MFVMFVDTKLPVLLQIVLFMQNKQVKKPKAVHSSRGTVSPIRQQSRAFACRAIVTCFVPTGSYMSSACRQQSSLRRQ
jgi:hypothetical protein